MTLKSTYFLLITDLAFKYNFYNIVFREGHCLKLIKEKPKNVLNNASIETCTLRKIQIHVFFYFTNFHNFMRLAHFFVQAFYMCQPNGESTAFLCPNGTMFNQQYFVCDWWYNLDCAEQPNFYNYNQLIYDSPENEGKKCTSLFCKDD